MLLSLLNENYGFFDRTLPVLLKEIIFSCPAAPHTFFQSCMPHKMNRGDTFKKTKNGNPFVFTNKKTQSFLTGFYQSSWKKQFWNQLFQLYAGGFLLYLKEKKKPQCFCLY